MIKAVLYLFDEDTYEIWGVADGPEKITRDELEYVCLDNFTLKEAKKLNVGDKMNIIVKIIMPFLNPQRMDFEYVNLPTELENDD